MANTSTASSSYGDRVAKCYKVQDHITRDGLEAKMEALGQDRVRKMLQMVIDQDEPDEKQQFPVKLLQERENYRIYEVKQAISSDYVVLKGVLLLQSSNCEEVMELLSGRTQQECMDFHHDVFGSQLEDARLLYHAPMTSTSPSRSISSMSFHWMALKDTSSHLPMRDFLYMRYNQAFPHERDADNSSSRIAYGASAWESIELPTCTPIFSTTIMQRSTFQQCGFVVESSDSEAETTRVSFFIASKRSTNGHQVGADMAWLLKMASCVKLIPSAIVNHRIRRNQLIDKTQWDLKDTCALCTSSFSLFRRQHHCRMCGASVCSKCSSMRQQSTGSSASSSSTSTKGTRVCLSCLNGEDATALWAQSTSKRIRDSTTSSHTSSSYSIDPARISAQSTESFSSCARVSALEELLEASKISFASSSQTTKSSVDMDEDDVVVNTPCTYPLTFQKRNAWPDPPIPASEQARLQRIKTLNLSQQSTAVVKVKELLEFARTSVSCPVAAVAVLSASTSLLVTSIGLHGDDQLPRDMALEAHTIMSNKPLVALDTSTDNRFAKNPLVLKLKIRFYIGIPLISKEGIVVGSLSLGATTPRDKVSGSDIRSLQRIAARIMSRLDNDVQDQENRPTAAPVKGMLLI